MGLPLIEWINADGRMLVWQYDCKRDAGENGIGEAYKSIRKRSSPNVKDRDPKGLENPLGLVFEMRYGPAFGLIPAGLRLFV
jgi:hypothetical protein